MGETTGIEWTDHTFNPWLGCSKVSPACAHCYAEVNRAVVVAEQRVNAPLWGPDSARLKTSESYWKQPYKWNRDALAAGVRRRVFCASLADVFEDRRDLDAHRADLFRAIYDTPHLDWLLLTKRPEKIAELVGRAFNIDKRMEWLLAWLAGNPLPNIWLGTTAEDQAHLDIRAKHLLSVPARVHFLSMEPLLSAVDVSALTNPIDKPRIDWVIVGGESGPKSRPMHPDWARSVRAQCEADGVPFFFKQWGEWSPRYDLEGVFEGTRSRTEVERSDRFRIVNHAGGFGFHGEGAIYMENLGKKAAGSLLDGVSHKAFPVLA